MSTRSLASINSLIKDSETHLINNKNISDETMHVVAHLLLFYLNDTDEKEKVVLYNEDEDSFTYACEKIVNRFKTSFKHLPSARQHYAKVINELFFNAPVSDICIDNIYEALGRKVLRLETMTEELSYWEDMHRTGEFIDKFIDALEKYGKEHPEVEAELKREDEDGEYDLPFTNMIEIAQALLGYKLFSF